MAKFVDVVCERPLRQGLPYNTFFLSISINQFLFILQEIEPTPCPLGCGLEFRNPTSLDMHLKSVHSVTKQQIKHAQRIPMNNRDFLLVLAQDNVMCFTARGCNTKLSCLSSARRHYKQKHEEPEPVSGLTGGQGGHLPTQGHQLSYGQLSVQKHLLTQEHLPTQGHLSTKGHLFSQGHLPTQGHLLTQGHLPNQGHLSSKGYMPTQGHMPTQGYLPTQNFNY